MERKLKILKAVLLLRQVNRYNSKEKQIADAEKYYTDQQIDEWIELLKNPEKETGIEDESEIDEPVEMERPYTSCTAHDYSPSNP